MKYCAVRVQTDFSEEMWLKVPVHGVEVNERFMKCTYSLTKALWEAKKYERYEDAVADAEELKPFVSPCHVIVEVYL